jgi:hypothetical protein
MKIDIQYIKNLLDIILEHNHPDFRIDIPEIKRLWSNDETLNKLVFHMEILEDQYLIESSTSSEGIGFRRMSNGTFTVSVKPLRLTAEGHQFSADLSKPGVIEQLTKSFQELGPAETIKVAFTLGQKAIEEKLSSLIGE